MELQAHWLASQSRAVPDGTRILESFFSILLVGIVVWPVATFGAVYSWAYTPLLIACALTGVIGLSLGAGRSSPINWGLTLTLLLIALAAAAQLVPLSTETLRRVAPASDAFLRQYQVGYAYASRAGLAVHPLSIDPSATWLGLLFFATFGLFLTGLASGLTLDLARRITQTIVIVGPILAILGIVQKATFNGKLYWFWTPIFDPGNAFGPFVNRNHFAGWMIMALSVTLGVLLARVARGFRDVRPDWSSRLAWFSSASASRLALMAFGAVVMGLALVFTMSRSGLLSFVLAVSLTLIVAVRRLPGAGARLVALTYLVLLLATAIGWTGMAAIQSRFGEAGNINGRFGAWEDTVRIIRDFPITGSGLNTYGTATLFYQRSNPTWHLAEAHNDYLQLVAEGGALIAVPAIAAVALFVLQVRKRFRQQSESVSAYWLRVGAVTGLVAIAFQETVEFSLQVPGNAALFCLLAAISLSPLSRGNAVSKARA